MAGKQQQQPVPSDRPVKKPKRSSEQTEADFRKQIEEELGGQMVGPYQGTSIPILCFCEEGHECNPTPKNIFAGWGMCRICGGNDTKESERKFRERIATLGGKIVGNYVTTGTKIECICIQGHKCFPIPNKVLQGRGMCWTCSGRDPKEGERVFHANVAALNGFVLGTYINSNTRVECLCENAHECAPIPSGLQQGEGMCRKCVHTDPEKAELHFIAKIKELGGKILSTYNGSTTPVLCLCPNGHQCSPRPENIIQGQGMCLQCVTMNNNSETKFGSLLEKMGLTNIASQFRFPSPDNKWRFDFQVGTCIFEFDGPQHFDPVKLFGGEETFKKQRERDLEKMRVITKNKYRMIRVHYHWILKHEHTQLKFLTEALKSTESLIVSDLNRYQWLADAGFSPKQIM